MGKGKKKCKSAANIIINDLINNNINYYNNINNNYIIFINNINNNNNNNDDNINLDLIKQSIHQVRKDLANSIDTIIKEVEIGIELDDQEDFIKKLKRIEDEKQIIIKKNPGRPKKEIKEDTRQKRILDYIKINKN